MSIQNDRENKTFSVTKPGLLLGLSRVNALDVTAQFPARLGREGGVSMQITKRIYCIIYQIEPIAVCDWMVVRGWA